MVAARFIGRLARIATVPILTGRIGLLQLLQGLARRMCVAWQNHTQHQQEQSTYSRLNEVEPASFLNH